MRMAVDLPAPFSPTMAWIVPGSTLMLTWSLARTAPKRFVILRSSNTESDQRPKTKSQRPLFGHPIRHFDLAVDNLLFCFFNLLNHLRRDQVFVVFVHCVAHAVLV